MNKTLPAEQGPNRHEGPPASCLRVPAGRRRWTRRRLPRKTAAADDRTGSAVVAVTFPLSSAQRAVLRQMVGPDAVLCDSRTVDHADLVLVTPCSVQVMNRLRRQYDDAAIVVLDAAPSSATATGGPVGRLLDAGADDYIGAGWRERPDELAGER